MQTAIETCTKVVEKYTALGYYMGMSCNPTGYIYISLHLFNRARTDIVASAYYEWPKDEAKLTELANAV